MVCVSLETNRAIYSVTALRSWLYDLFINRPLAPLARDAERTEVD